MENIQKKKYYCEVDISARMRNFQKSMFCRYKNLENFQNIWGAVLLFIIKKRYHFQMNWYQLETWSDITLECDITLATLSDITLN